MREKNLSVKKIISLLLELSVSVCAVTGVCSSCSSPDCMCCNIVITRHSRYTGRIKVILVGEALGV